MLGKAAAAGYKALRIGDMHILFVTATRIGDAVLSTGLLSYLVERYPGARLTDRGGAGSGAAVRGRARARADRWSWTSGAGRCIGCRFTPRVARPALGPRRRSARLGARLAAARRRRAGSWPRAMRGEHRVRQLGRLFDLDPPPRAAAVDRAAARARRPAALLAAGRPGVGDRPGRQLARQAVAGRAFCRAGAAADRRERPAARERGSRCWPPATSARRPGRCSTAIPPRPA